MIVGHDSVKRQIPDLKAVSGPTLFVGPEGVGKRTFAEELVADLHPALQQRLYSPTVDEIRNLCTWFLRKPMGGPVKAAIVELTRAGQETQNALLKLLEEPPPYARIILVSATIPLGTIMSRCRVARFYPLSHAQVVEVLESQGMSSTQASIVAEFGDGSVGRAKTFEAAEETYYMVQAALSRPTPADAAEVVLKLRSLEQMIVLVDLLSRKEEVNPGLMVALGRRAGVRGRFLSTLMHL